MYLFSDENTPGYQSEGFYDLVSSCSLYPTHCDLNVQTSQWVNGMPWFGQSHKVVVPCTSRATPGHVKVAGLFVKSRGSTQACCLSHTAVRSPLRRLRLGCIFRPVAGFEGSTIHKAWINAGLLLLLRKLTKRSIFGCYKHIPLLD